tara:strand:+ start:3110 stop:4423 length:1314 start_codon:yes stop_codon:yes gene_type:complete
MSEEWNEKDEFVSAGKTLPDGVLERIKAQAERTKKSVEETTKQYLDFIKAEWNCDDPYSEDEDLLLDWAESAFVTMRRTGSGASGSTTSFVGCFVGVADKRADRMEWRRRRAIEDFTNDPAQIIESGRLGVYAEQDGKWQLHTSGDPVLTDLSTDQAPEYAFKADGKWVTFVTTMGQRPYPSVRMGRYLYFLGNEEGEFVNNGNISLWRVDATDDAADAEYQIGRPCRIQVRLPGEKVSENFKDVLGTNANFLDTIEYTDAFVNEDVQPLLKPSVFWLNSDFHDMYVPIDELGEAYDTRSRSFEGRDGNTGTAGPLVFTKGTVSRMSSEPRESEYDQEGFNYSLSLTHGTLTDDVTGWISFGSARGGDPFSAGWGEESFPYAERSTVLVFGRIGMRVSDGKARPKLNIFGVYADPRRGRRRADGGDTGLDQFKDGDE